MYYLPGAEMHVDPLLVYPSFAAPGIFSIRASGAESEGIHIACVNRLRDIRIQAFQSILS